MSSRHFRSQFPDRGSDRNSDPDLFRSADPKNKPLPRPETLRDYGIEPSDFERNHTVVCCEKCEEIFGTRIFVMLKYVERRPGCKAVAVGFKPHPRGRGGNSRSEARIIWSHAIGFRVDCEENHLSRLDPVTGEVTCVARKKEEG